MIPVITPWLGDEEAAAAAAVVRSGWVAQGPRVAEFEEEFAAHVDAAAAVAVSSGTAALHLSLHALGIGPGDEVVVPSLSFIATANAPRYVGATPVFADVDRTTQNVTAETIAAVMSQATRAVIVVHQVGMPADLEPIRKLCNRRGVAVVEDAACAAGSTYRGRPIGSHSELVAFSFHPRKLLTTGEGGMITTSNPELADRLRRLRQHGMSVPADARHASAQLIIEEYGELGFNYRMTDVQAAIGLVQLGKLDAIVSRRRELAATYAGMLEDVVEVPRDPAYGTTNYQSYVVVLGDSFEGDRDGLLQAMMDDGISPRRGVMAAHREPAFAGYDHPPLPVTEYLAARSLILPLFHEMTADQQHRVAAALAR